MPTALRKDVLAVRIEGGGSTADKARSFLAPAWDGIRHGSRGRMRSALWVKWATAAPPGPLTLYLATDRRHRRYAISVLRQCATGCRQVELVTAAEEDDLFVSEQPFASDEQLIAQLRACLTESSELLIYTSLQHRADAGPESSYADRQVALFAMLSDALYVAFENPSLRADYLTYHRDWLVRARASDVSRGAEKASEILERLDVRLRQSGLPRAGPERARYPDKLPVGPVTAWLDSLSQLMAYASVREAGQQPEPGSPTPGCRFPILFRLLHATARQFGISLLDEAFLYHRLRQALEPPAAVDDLTRALGPAPGSAPAPDAESNRSLPIPRDGSKNGSSSRSPLNGKASVSDDYQWRDLVSATGSEGRAWVETFTSTEANLDGALPRALSLLRRGRVDEGYELIGQVQEYRRTQQAPDPGVFHVLSNVFHGVFGYYKYVIGDLAGAASEMDEAAAAIRRAIELHRFLLPMAPMLVNTPLQKARIARRAGNGHAVVRHLTEMYNMEVERTPLCVLHSGTAIDYAALRGYLAERDLPAAVWAHAEAVLDERLRLQRFRWVASTLYGIAAVTAIDSPVLH